MSFFPKNDNGLVLGTASSTRGRISQARANRDEVTLDYLEEHSGKPIGDRLGGGPGLLGPSISPPRFETSQRHRDRLWTTNAARSINAAATTYRWAVLCWSRRRGVSSSQVDLGMDDRYLPARW